MRIHARNSRVGVFFDLDSTLFCVSFRTQAILRSLGRDPKFQAQFEKQAAVLAEVEVLPTDWGLRSLMQRYHPEGPQEFFKQVRDYWRSRFFSSHFLDHDQIYPAANEYVRHLHELGADVFYLTGRPETLMRSGTLSSLAKFGFPLVSDSRLLMKPLEVETDEHYKTTTLKSLAPKFDHIWFFENEPVIINEVRAAVPNVRIVFVNSVHSGRAPTPTDLPTIGMGFHGDWLDSRRSG